MRNALFIWTLAFFAFATGLRAEVSMKGSKASLIRQKEMADEYGLPPIANAEQREELLRAGRLLPLQEIDHLGIDPRLEASKRWALPHLSLFLEDLDWRIGEAGKREGFNVRQQINSALRTGEQQGILQETNSNAASLEYAAHTRGATVDLARFVWRNGKKVWYPPEYVAWLERYLLDLEAKGLIEFSREEKQAVYHVTVSSRYGRPQPEPQESIPPGTLLALIGNICMQP